MPASHLSSCQSGTPRWSAHGWTVERSAASRDWRRAGRSPPCLHSPPFVTAQASFRPVAAAVLCATGAGPLRLRRVPRCPGRESAGERRRAESPQCLGARRHRRLVRERPKGSDSAYVSRCRCRLTTIASRPELAVAPSAGRISDRWASWECERVSRTLPADAALVERTF